MIDSEAGIDDQNWLNKFATHFEPDISDKARRDAMVQMKYPDSKISEILQQTFDDPRFNGAEVSGAIRNALGKFFFNRKSTEGFKSEEKAALINYVQWAESILRTK